MRKILSTLFASALTASFAVSSVVPLNAAPLVVPEARIAAPAAQPDVVQIQDRGDMRWMRKMGPRHGNSGPRPVIRDSRRGDMKRVVRRDFDRRHFQHRGDYAWYKGHRGYRNYRPGYREYNGFWFPAAAFVAGAIISGAIANQPRAAYGNSHVQWCYDRYRSYRASDNTFQPYNGPRQQCYSPYS
ncbi:MAG: BA14K family protein [Rhizobiaceae bacterium]